MAINDFDMNFLTPYILVGFAMYACFKIFRAVQHHFMLKRWSKASKAHKDTVILHCLQRGQTIPSISPFVLKLETYLRMENIPYKTEFKNPKGPKGKTPWISFNGENISDSQLIIEILSKKFDKPLNASYSTEQLALGTLARVTLEEHVFWGLTLWAFREDPNQTIAKKMRLSWLRLKSMECTMKRQAWGHGLGRHTKDETQQLIMKDLRSISHLLGNKKYFLGLEPAGEIDPAMFGMLAQIFWGLALGSPYEKLVNEEMPNLKQYCFRMKEKFYPDWNSILDK